MKKIIMMVEQLQAGQRELVELDEQLLHLQVRRDERLALVREAEQYLSSLQEMREPVQELLPSEGITPDTKMGDAFAPPKYSTGTSLGTRTQFVLDTLLAHPDSTLSDVLKRVVERFPGTSPDYLSRVLYQQRKKGRIVAIPVPSRELHGPRFLYRTAQR